MKTRKNTALEQRIKDLSLHDQDVIKEIYQYMQLHAEDMVHLVENMMTILQSQDNTIKAELYELYRRIKEKQWEDDDRAFKKNVYMIIETLAEDS